MQWEVWTKRSDSGVRVRLVSKAPGNRAGGYVSPANHRVTDGARTRDLRDHNPMLCQLSYGHQAPPNGGLLILPPVMQNVLNRLDRR